MTAERYRQAGELFHAATALAPSERADFLAKACAGDEELRREVELLLESGEEAGSFLGKPEPTRSS